MLERVWRDRRLILQREGQRAVPGQALRFLVDIVSGQRLGRILARDHQVVIAGFALRPRPPAFCLVPAENGHWLHTHETGWRPELERAILAIVARPYLEAPGALQGPVLGPDVVEDRQRNLLDAEASRADAEELQMELWRGVELQQSAGPGDGCDLLRGAITIDVDHHTLPGRPFVRR